MQNAKLRKKTAPAVFNLNYSLFIILYSLFTKR